MRTILLMAIYGWSVSLGLAQVQWQDSLFRVVGRTPQVGVLKANGDTLLPFEYHKILPFQGSRFVVYRPDGQCGLVDASGTWVIPFNKGILSQIKEHPKGVWILSGPMNSYSDRVFTSEGKEIQIGEVQVESLSIPLYCASFNLPGRHPKSYFLTKNKQKDYFLYNFRGDLLLGPTAAIQYLSDSAVVLVRSKEGPKGSLAFAHRLSNLSEVVLMGFHQQLLFTEYLDLLLGQHLNGNWGFVDLNQQNRPLYPYDQVPQRLVSGYNKVHQPWGFGVCTGRGEPLVTCQFDSIASLTFFQERAAKAVLPNTSVVAAAFEVGMGYDEWIAVDEKGQLVHFKGGTIQTSAHKKQVVEQVVAPPPVQTLDDLVYSLAEVGTPPAFPGGDTALEAYLLKNLRYPRLAKEAGIQGMVLVEAIIETDGTIREATIKRGIGAGTEEEALRLVKSSPKWRPGRRLGGVVRVKRSIPVRFYLN